jgi:hypothetical protein
MSDSPDPTATLEQKLNAFAADLTEDERTVLHDVVHLAYEGSEVQGFAVPLRHLGRGGDPCEGGEVTFPNTFSMIDNLHTSLHPPGPTRPPGTPVA